MKLRLLVLALAAVGLLGLCDGVVAATWSEVGDAGELLGTAQVVTGSGVLTQISGSVLNNYDADLFRIYIHDPENFTATTLGGASFDTMLWLFNASGYGVISDDDFSGSYGESKLSKGTAYQPPTAGFYYLGISAFYYLPQNSSGGMFYWENVLAPDGNYIGSPTSPASPLFSWILGGPTISGPEPYTIFLEGASAEAPLTPIPGAVWLLGSGLVGLWGVSRLRRYY